MGEYDGVAAIVAAAGRMDTRKAVGAVVSLAAHKFMLGKNPEQLGQLYQGDKVRCRRFVVPIVSTSSFHVIVRISSSRGFHVNPLVCKLQARWRAQQL